MSPAAARRRATSTRAAVRAAIRRPSRRGAAVATAVRQSGGAAVRKHPPVKIKPGPQDNDPKFKAALQRLDHSTAKAKHHEPATKKAGQAQAASMPPENEKVAGARANQVDAMSTVEGKKPDPKSFRDMLKEEIKKAMPKKVEEGKEYMKGDDRTKLKGSMTGNIDQQKENATGPIQQTTDAPPDTDKVEGKPVTPLPNDAPPGTPPAVGAGQAVPDPKPEQDVSLQGGKKSTDALMKDNELTPTQMEKANDPRFSKVNTEKGKADTYADTAPQKFRADEQKITTQAAAQATAAEARSLQGMKQVGGRSAAGVKAKQLTAKQKDEAARKAVTDHIQDMFNQTKTAVEKKLASLESEVGAMFDSGADAAVERMKQYVEKRFDDRYSGVIGKGKWLKDKLLPLPDFVKAWFDEANDAFQNDLMALVDQVADLVERRIKEAKDEVDKGQQAIHTYVEGLSPELQGVGKAAEKEITSQFDELRQGVEDKKNDLAQSLAQKYKDAYDKGAAALKEMKDAHKSLYEKVRDAIEEVLKVLREFRTRIASMLKKGKDTISLIISDPIGFLKNLLNAIKKGLQQFVDNIWTHLKAGFMKWLFGSLADAGVEVPKDFSLGSILKLVLQVLGLTYQRIRPKIVKIIGERNVAFLEKAFELIKALWEGGPAALWEKIKEFLGDLKQMLIDMIQDWVITTVIKAAVTKLATMFNPVGAIIQAIITIYNTVMFLIERINQILDFVEAVINSVHKIATGDIASAANWVEQALANTIPIIIAFLARLLGISGVTDKIVGFIKKIQNTVSTAVDKLIAMVVGGIGKLLGKGKAKDPDKPKSPEQAKWDNAVAMIHVDLEKMEAEGATSKDLDAAIPKWKQTYGFTALTVTTKDEEYDIDGAMSPKKNVGKVHRSGSKKNPFRLHWPKPASTDYPVLFFGGKTPRAKKQSAFKGLESRGQADDTGQKIIKYYPNERAKLPGGETIGLTSAYRIGVGSIVGPLTDETTKGGKKILDILYEYGFRADPEYLDGDHVKEIQFGGQDTVANLWPLNATVNRGAGSTLSKRSVEYPNSGKTIKISELKKNSSVKYYFRITKVDS